MSRSSSDEPRGTNRPLDDNDNNDLDPTQPAHPMRDTDRLYAAPETIHCAAHNCCIPCAYKIGLFDVSLDKEFCQQVPNQRPEQCFRLLSTTRSAQVQSSTETSIISPSIGYHPGMSVLTVGDGDFSFSLAVARILFGTTQQSRSDVTTKSKLVATSYESEDTLRRVYPNFDETLDELHQLGATTLYQVDATRLDKTLAGESSSVQQFHRICWNFPCTAIAKGQDGQNQEMEDNKELIRKFVVSAMHYLATNCGDGEIHIAHKSKPPYDQWKLEDVALEGLRGHQHRHDVSVPLEYTGRIVLDRALLLPYVPRKALDRKSFPCHDACIHVFRCKTPKNRKGKHLPAPFTSTLPFNWNNEAYAAGGSNDGKTSDSHRPMPVTSALIQSIRSGCIVARATSSKQKRLQQKANKRARIHFGEEGDNDKRTKGLFRRRK